MKLITFITLLLLGTSAWAVGTQKIAGYAGETTGGVAFAFNKLGQKRKLGPQTPVYEGETLITSKTASSSVIFTDGTTIELNPSTQFRVEEFRFGEEVEKPSAVFRMLKGGFRFISGLVNKSNGGKLAFKTPTATIGVRGSAGSINADGTVTVYEGSFTVATSNGSTTTLAQGESAQASATGVKKTVKLTKAQVQAKVDALVARQKNAARFVGADGKSTLLPQVIKALEENREKLAKLFGAVAQKETEAALDSTKKDEIAAEIKAGQNLLNQFNSGGGSDTSIQTTCKKGQTLVKGVCTTAAAGGSTSTETASQATP